MIKVKIKIELFCWTTLLTLVVLSFTGIVPWWSTAGWTFAFAMLMRIWVWALRRSLSMFYRLYSLASATIRRSCSPDVVREWKFHDDEIVRIYSYSDDDDTKGGVRVQHESPSDSARCGSSTTGSGKS